VAQFHIPILAEHKVPTSNQIASQASYNVHMSKYVRSVAVVLALIGFVVLSYSSIPEQFLIGIFSLFIFVVLAFGIWYVPIQQPIKLIIIFATMLFMEALVLSAVSQSLAIGDDLAILLFPGLLGLAFGGVNPLSLIIVLAITGVLYGIGGLLLNGVYVFLQKFLPIVVAFIITIIIPALVFGLLLYKDYQDNRAFFHRDDTPASCAALPADEINWCYRTIYQRYPTAAVCSQLEYGEAEDCWRLCAEATGSNCRN
jgi:hypothetical protein